MIVCRGPVIERRHLPLTLQSGPVNQEPAGPRLSFAEKRQFDERETIIRALEQNGWNRGRTAAALKIDRTTLWRKMKKYGIFS